MVFSFSRRTREAAGLLRFLPALLAGAALLTLASCPNPAAGGSDPNDLKVSAAASGSRVEVKWTAPVDESQVTEYIVRLKDKDGKEVRFDGGGRTNLSEIKIQKTSADGGKYSFTITVAALGDYYPEVVIVNLENKELPPQKPAKPAKVTTLASPPSAPGGLKITGHFFDTGNPTSQTAELSWTRPADSGKDKSGKTANLTAYTVYWAEGSSVDKTASLKKRITPASAGAVPATTLRIDGFPLDAGKDYAFVVTASNDANLEGFASAPAEKPALNFAVRDLRATVKDNDVTVSWTALSGNPEAKSYKVYFKPQAGDAVTATVGQGEGTITYTHRLGKGTYAIEVTVLRSDGTESNPTKVSGTIEVASTSVFLSYKGDAALQDQADKFSLGDFDHERLFRAGGLTAHTSSTIRQKVTVKVGDTEKHAGTPRDLAVDAQGNSAHFGIGGMDYATWEGIDDNADVTITIELTAAGGTQIASETLTKRKTPDGDIRTWRDLQNMKHKLGGSYAVRNDFAFPDKDAQGFQGFAPVGDGSAAFTGKLDGNGKTISKFHASSAGNDVGIIGSMGAGGEIKNLRMLDPYVKGNTNVGVFVGTMAGTASLLRVEASRAAGVMVEGIGSAGIAGGFGNLGGLVGHVAAGAAGVIIGAASGEVKGGFGSSRIGGLVGNIEAAVTVAGIASGAVGGGSVLGGLVGAYPTGSDKVAGYWDKEATGRDGSAGGGFGIGKIADVTYRYGRYFDGEAEVFNDAEWLKHFHLPKEGGKWPLLVTDSSTPPSAPVLKVVKSSDITASGNKNTIRLSWDAPAASGKTAGGGDATISQYTVYWRAEGGQSGTQPVAGAATGTATIANLDSGKSHTFTVTATNNAGREGPHSVEQTAAVPAVSYKSDASLSGHSDKFSLGDFDGTRLFKAVGLADYAGQTIKQKVSVKEGDTDKHDGTAADIDVDERGEAHFGITGMTYAAWAGITDNANVTIRVELTASGGTAIKTQEFTKEKTPDGDIYTWRDLQNMKHKLDGGYTLRDDISFPAAGSEGLAAGRFHEFTPVGSSTAAFSGSLNGNDKTITGLYIRGEQDLGLFGYISAAAKETEVVSDLTVDKPDVRGTNRHIGSVAGRLVKGSIINVAAANVNVGANVTGGSYSGGLVGNILANGILEGELRSGSVQGNEAVGGLAGGNVGTVRGLAAGKILASKRFSSGSVNGHPAGGLVGTNWGTVMGRSSGEVTAHSRAGGLAGENEGSVWGIFTGKVTTVGGRAGGLVGLNGRTSAKAYGAALGSVSGAGTQGVGGLVGMNQNGAEVRGWSTATVNNVDVVGGMVGYNGRGDKVQGYALGYVSANATRIGAAIGQNENTTTADVVVFAGRKQAEKTANDATPGSGDHVGVVSTTALTGVQRTGNDIGTVQVESTTAPTLAGLTYGTAAGEWKTEAGKRWPILVFHSDFPGGQPAQDPKIPEKPANFYE